MVLPLEVKRKIGVVLTKEISSAVHVRSAWSQANLHPVPSFCIATERSGANSVIYDDIGIGAIGLRRVRLHSHVKSHLPGQIGVRDEVNLCFSSRSE